MSNKILVSFLIVLFFLSAISVVCAQEQILIKLGHIMPISDLTGQAADRFAEELNKRSNGKIKVEVYPAGQLGGERELLEGLQIETIQMGVIALGLLSLYDPLANLFVMPYMIRSTKHCEKVWGGPIGEEIFESIRQKAGIRVLPFLLHRGDRYLTVNKPVYSPGDLKGIKIRVPEDPISIATWEAFGANPVAMSYTEVFSALKQGVIDAQENPLSNIYSMGVHQVLKYLVLTGHLRHEDFSFMFNDKFWQGLPEDLKTLILEIAKETQQWAYQELLMEENLLLGKIVLEGKMDVIYPDIKAFEKLAREIPKQQFPELMDYYNKIVAVKD